MRLRMRALGAVLVCLGMGLAGCSSTTATSSGGVQDEAVASASASGAAPEAVEASEPAVSCADGGVCAFGDTGPGGGVVFYVATAPFSAPGTACGDACMYLETPTFDVAAPILWCSGPGAATGFSVDAMGTAIGSGWLNTQAMLGTTNSPPAEICTSGAAQAASTPVGGLSDWYLPSTDEMSTLLDAVVGGGLATQYGVNFSFDAYWTSTQASGKNYATAYCQGFTSLKMGTCDKTTNPQAVHSIRAF